jgi:MFS family permease
VWGFTAAQVGAITSYGLFGMLIGALGIVTISDVIGRKRSILVTVAGFSVFTALGWAAGIGRVGAICRPILGGMLLGAGLAVVRGFYAFAGVGLLGCVFIAAVHRSPAGALWETLPSPEGAAQ